MYPFIIINNHFFVHGTMNCIFENELLEDCFENYIIKTYKIFFNENYDDLE